MSHFTVIVLVPQIKVTEPGHPDFESQLIEVVEKMLAPFDENRNVRAYQRECNCGMYTASRKSRELATEETGLTIQMLRESYPSVETEGVSWEDHIAPFVEVQERYKRELMRDVKPDNDCSECKGTGFYRSTYNPLSKWDWYSIGGRWDNDFEENDPKIPSIIPNVAFARDVQTAAYTPFAILSPREKHQKQRHDNWSQKGDMGWWGMTSNENDNWPAIANELLGKYSGCFAVLMDLHI